MFGTYDSWKCATPPEYETGTPSDGRCPVCEGGEDCFRIAMRSRSQRRVKAMYARLRGALKLARRYEAERQALGMPRDHRIIAVLELVQEYRGLIRAERAARR